MSFDEKDFLRVLLNRTSDAHPNIRKQLDLVGTKLPRAAFERHRVQIDPRHAIAVALVRVGADPRQAVPVLCAAARQNTDAAYVRSASRAFYQTFHVSPAETEGRLIYELGNGEWDIPRKPAPMPGVLIEMQCGRSKLGSCSPSS